LLRQGDRVLVAVSGGPDSQSLLHSLFQLRHELGIQLTVAHINHQLRPGAAGDERLVIKTCKSLNLPVFLKRLTFTPAEKRGSFSDREKSEVRTHCYGPSS
jgi:tRNA(Ile)-lysidine synthase